MKKIIHFFLLMIIIAWVLQGAPQAQESLPQPERVEQITPSRQGPTDRAELEAFLEGIMVSHMESYHIGGATLAEFLERKMPARVLPPGKLTSYSNYGAALAGYIVEKISGMPFEDYVEQNIFELLDMQQSTFRQPPYRKLWGH